MFGRDGKIQSKHFKWHVFFNNLQQREEVCGGKNSTQQKTAGQQKACNKEEKSDRTITILVHVQYIIANKTTK